ncbi:unnamed protein product [Orchesella dallaii]|uniref:Uncharacterized protein n=1 Tax=Orchesella dallaii TaxID=48710 RepID=A0ABP1RR18_9HEXA
MAITFLYLDISDLLGTTVAKATSYFEVFQTLLIFTKHFSFFWMITTKKIYIEDMLTKAQSSWLLHTTKQQHKQIALLYFIVLHVIKAITSIFAILNLPPFQNFSAAVAIGRSRFLIENGNSTMTQFYTINDVFFGTSEILLILSNQVATYFIAMISYGAYPVTFWLAAHGFQKIVKEELSFPVGNSNKLFLVRISIFDRYEELKDLTTGMNKVFSTTVFLQLMERSFRVILLHQRVSGKNIAFLAYYIVDITFLGIALILMAEGCRIVSKNIITDG